MAYGIYVATAGAVARQKQLDVEAHNLANVSTTGFRKSEVTFEALLGDAQAPTRRLTKVGDERISQAPGAIRTTGNPLDLRLEGDAFFAVEGPEGRPLLARSFSASVDPQGVLRDGAGRALLGEGGPIVLAGKGAVEVDPTGRLTQNGQLVGALQVVRVEDPTVLTPVGGSAFAVAEGVELEPDLHARVVSGELEISNVNPVESMVRLVRLERDHQALMKVIGAYREADDQLIATGSGQR